MTEKLYYTDASLQQTTVNVIRSGEDDKGSYVILDQTCFYPEGGGQPADTGKIGTVNVRDVQTVEEEIRHYTEHSLTEGAYIAAIDYDRRWDHMQQHAGQHVLSAVFEDTYGMATTSFHIGTERVSIDLNAKEITAELLREAEQKANSIIQQHIPIETIWTTLEEVSSYSLRKPPAVEGPIRLVMIDGFDINACGGTHPDNTAQIGSIKVIGTEKAKGGTRVYFLCGLRAFNYFQQLLDTTDELVRKLNAPVPQLTEAAEFLLKEKAAAEKTIQELQLKVLQAEAQTLSEAHESKEIMKEFTGRSIKEVQQLARLTVAASPSAVLLFTVTEGDDFRFVCAKGEEAEGDMRPVLKELLAMVNGKGGGNAKFGQGGGQKPDSLDAFFGLFRSTLGRI